MSDETEKAIRLASLWRAGKMIGGDPHDVCEILLGEIERLREGLFLIEQLGHGNHHGRGYTLANIAENLLKGEKQDNPLPHAATSTDPE